MANGGGGARRGSGAARAARAALKVGLLALPSLFWSAVFASLAGERALERLSLLAEWWLRIAESW
ncbi:MAG TPA: hypothetical protein VN228_01395 [Pyrinomonadaceae bacterium]|nr:hypothetical protein [Pyrinomonadaceae bacterium]